MSTEYLHGVRVIEINNGTRPLRTVSTAVIGTYASYFLDSITGAIIVVLQGGLFLAVFAVRRLQHLARLRHEPHP